MTNTIKTDNALLVTVPSGAHRFKIGYTNQMALSEQLMRVTFWVGKDKYKIILPPGEYEILGLAEDLSVEDLELYAHDINDSGVWDLSTLLVLKRK